MSKDGNSDGSLLSRWSQRKRAVAEQEATEQTHAENLAAIPQHGLAADATVEDNPQEQETDEQILERLGLPDPDAMEKGDDFSAFMKSTVPARIRNRALRKLWISNPVLANLDELVDYGEDFTDAATVIENLQTAYQVGRGFLTDDDEETNEEEDALGVAEHEDDSIGDPANDGEKSAETLVDDGTDERQGAASVESANSTIPETAHPAGPQDDLAYSSENTPKNEPKTPSRMRFRFDDA